MRSNPSSPGTQCSPDASVDISDGKTIFERQTKSCPTGFNVKTPSTVDELLNLNGRHPSGATKEKPVTTDSDDLCAKFEGVNKHVTCGGPEIGPTEQFVAIVLNCVPGQFSSCLFNFYRSQILTSKLSKDSQDFIEARPRFHRADKVAEFCCARFDEDDMNVCSIPEIFSLAVRLTVWFLTSRSCYSWLLYVIDWLRNHWKLWRTTSFCVGYTWFIRMETWAFGINVLFTLSRISQELSTEFVYHAS